MQSWFKTALIPVAVALTCGTANAAAGIVGAEPPNSETAQPGGDVMLAHHNYWHTQRQWERRHARRYYYQPYYGPRCHWSNYYGRRICR